MIYSKLIKSKLLRARRSVNIIITPIIFFSNLDSNPTFNHSEWPELIFVNNLNSLKVAITKSKSPIENEKFNEIRAVIEGSKGLSTDSGRPLKNNNPNTKGRIIERIDAEIATFDAEQKKLGLR